MATNQEKLALGKLDYTIKHSPTFYNLKRYTNTPFIILDFGTLRNKEGQNVKVEIVQLTRTSYTTYINGEDIGPYDKIGTLSFIFNASLAQKIINTVMDASFEITHNMENLKVYVPNPKFDPAYIKKTEQSKAYWSKFSSKFEQLIDNNMSTTTAFYMTEQLPNDQIRHTKFRISNIKQKTVNIDESTIITDSNDCIIQPEKYIQTITKIDKDGIASWLNFSKFISMESFNTPTTIHFNK